MYVPPKAVALSAVQSHTPQGFLLSQALYLHLVHTPSTALHTPSWHLPCVHQKVQNLWKYDMLISIEVLNNFILDL